MRRLQTMIETDKYRLYWAGNLKVSNYAGRLIWGVSFTGNCARCQPRSYHGASGNNGLRALLT